MDMKKFKKKWSKAKTWADGIRLVEKLTPEQKKTMYGHLVAVDNFSGLDSRDKFLMSEIKSQLRYPKEKYRLLYTHKREKYKTKSVS